MPIPVTIHWFYNSPRHHIGTRLHGAIVWNESDLKQFADVMFLSSYFSHHFVVFLHQSVDGAQQSCFVTHP